MEVETIRRINRKRTGDRQVDTLIGFCSGLVADGYVNQKESESLRKWLIATSAADYTPLIQNLLNRVDTMLSDGTLDESEAKELFDLLVQLTGNDFEVGELNKATTLPLCVPEPEIIVSGSRFCLTGTFAFGKRIECVNVISERGGCVGSKVLRSTDFLVIGTYVTDSWIHESYGRKIEQAVELRNKGVPIRIVSEQAWIRQLNLTSP